MALSYLGRVIKPNYLGQFRFIEWDFITNVYEDIIETIDSGKVPILYATDSEDTITYIPYKGNDENNRHHFIYTDEDAILQEYVFSSSAVVHNTTNLGGGASYTASAPIEINNSNDISLNYGSGLKVEDGTLKVDADNISSLIDDEIAEVVNSRILYTIDLSSIYGGNLISPNGLSLCGTLFSPNMNMELTNSTYLAYCSTQVGTPNNSVLYLALYEYDLATDTISWVANTDNVIDQMTTTGLHTTHFTYVKNNKYKVKSNKLYYFVVMTNLNGGGIVGNTYDSGINAYPFYLAFQQDNITLPTSSATIQTDIATISASNRSLNRFFAAITNTSLN